MKCMCVCVCKELFLPSDSGGLQGTCMSCQILHYPEVQDQTDLPRIGLSDLPSWDVLKTYHLLVKSLYAQLCIR